MHSSADHGFTLKGFACVMLKREYTTLRKRKKAPAYVPLQHRANSAEKPATQILKAPLIDEIAVIIGESDQFRWCTTQQPKIQTSAETDDRTAVRHIAYLLPGALSPA